MTPALEQIARDTASRRRVRLMMKKTLLALLLLTPLSLKAQGVRHVNIAQGSVTLAGSSGFSGAVARILSGASVTVCTGSTLPAAGSVCTGLATIYSDISLGAGFIIANPTTADTNGNYSFYAAGGVPYVISVSFIGFTTYSYVWSAPPSNAGSYTISGAWTFAGAINCTIVNVVRCISPSNPQGWGSPSTDPHVWINSAIANCVSNCEVDIAAGNYPSSTTTILLATGVTLRGAGPMATTLNYIGTGIAANMTSVLGGTLRDIKITTTSAAQETLHIASSNIVHVENFYFSGAPSVQHIHVTGDGVSTTSSNVFIRYGVLDGFTTNGFVVDHCVDCWIDAVDFSSVANNTTGNMLVLDRGVSGFYSSGLISGGGKHGLVIQNTSGGGSYGASPIYIFFDQLVSDTTTGGDAWLFDSTLSTNVVSAHFTNSWAAGAGLNTGGTVTTAASNCVHVSGGQGIYVGGGSRFRRCSGNGVLIDNSNVANVHFENDFILANNLDNNADQHGFYVTAAVSDLLILGMRIGNAIDSGGNQKYGIKLGAFAINANISENDLGNNVTGPYLNNSTGSTTQVANEPAASGIQNILYGGLVLGGNSNNNLSLGGLLLNGPGTATMGLTLKKGSGSGNYTNATTTYAVADSTNLCFAVTIPTTWKLKVDASGDLGTSTAVVEADVALTDNAACSTANAGILTEAPVFSNAAGNTEPFSLTWVIVGDGASHNVALQFKTTNAADTANLLNSSATRLPTISFTLMPSN